MITVDGGNDAMQALADGAVQEAQLFAYDVTQSGTPLIELFTNADILFGSLTVSKTCAPSGHLELGVAVSDELQVTLKTTSAIAQSLLKSKVELVVEWDYVDSQTNIQKTEALYVFAGVVTEVKKTAPNTYRITALDGMIAFDAPFRLSELTIAGTSTPLTYPVSIKNLLKSIVWSKGSPYLDPETVMETATPINLNANATVENVPEDQGYTYRQVLSWCAAWMGVNLRVNFNYDAELGFISALEMWRWDYPSQVSDYYDPPYGVDESNGFSIRIEEGDLSMPSFYITDGTSAIYGTPDPNGSLGLMVLYANPIILNLYDKYPLAFSAYSGYIYQKLYDVFAGLHQRGEVRTVAKWYLQPGDILGVISGNSGTFIIPTSITYRLNGATIIKADGYQEESSTTGYAQTLSPQYSNEITARFQEICYKRGDSYSGDYVYAHGYVTTGSTSLSVTFALPKIVTSDLPVTVTSVKLRLRKSPNGWVKTSGYDATSYLTSIKKWGNSLTLTFTDSNGWKDNNGDVIPTNTPVDGQLDLTIQFY